MPPLALEAHPDPTATRLVLVTAPAKETALSLARSLVAERLVACANVLDGVTSVYRWEGEVEEADEVLIVAKTSAARLDELERRVIELHPYDVPEFVVVDPAHVERRYAAWLTDACLPTGEGDDRT